MNYMSMMISNQTFYKPKTNYYEKNIIPVIPFCLLGMSLTFAQETDFNGDADFSEEEFRQKVDSVFQYMEYQGVDTGILIEHGFNFLNPRVFNGQNYVAKHFFAHFL